MDNDYHIIKSCLSIADEALNIFKIGLSPTSLDSLANHISRHILGMLAAKPSQTRLVMLTIGLMLKLTCNKEVQAFLKAEEAADASKSNNV